MGMNEEIDKAIAAHGAWKLRLRSAITSGASEFKPEVVCTDNNCEFGKWLYSLNPSKNELVGYADIKKLHADFHKEAGKILGEALSGKKMDPDVELGPKANYAQLSSQLVQLLMKAKAR